MCVCFSHVRWLDDFGFQKFKQKKNNNKNLSLKILINYIITSIGYDYGIHVLNAMYTVYCIHHSTVYYTVYSTPLVSSPMDSVHTMDSIA